MIKGVYLLSVCADALYPRSLPSLHTRRTCVPPLCFSWVGTRSQRPPLTSTRNGRVNTWSIASYLGASCANKNLTLSTLYLFVCAQRSWPQFSHVNKSRHRTPFSYTTLCNIQNAVRFALVVAAKSSLTHITLITKKCFICFAKRCGGERDHFPLNRGPHRESQAARLWWGKWKDDSRTGRTTAAATALTVSLHSRGDYPNSGTTGNSFQNVLLPLRRILPTLLKVYTYILYKKSVVCPFSFPSTPSCLFCVCVFVCLV